jgi:hypothetical protein
MTKGNEGNDYEMTQTDGKGMERTDACPSPQTEIRELRIERRKSQSTQY